jgi:hypothetical protein
VRYLFGLDVLAKMLVHFDESVWQKRRKNINNKLRGTGGLEETRLFL